MRQWIFGGLVAVCAAVCVAAGGCVTVYMPERVLGSPVVLDQTRSNFAGVNVLVRCLADDNMPAGDAEGLCRRVAASFRNQDADVDTEVLRGAHYTPATYEKPPDLIVELTSKEVHVEQNVPLAFLFYLTLTAVPYVEEKTYEASVTVRDARGSVLAAEVPRARFVTYTGILVWSASWLLDFFVRSDDEKMTGDAQNKVFSREFYGTVSQLAFNARVRQRLIRNLNAPMPVRPTAASPPAPSSTAPPASAPPASPPATPPASSPPASSPPASPPASAPPQDPAAQAPSRVLQQPPVLPNDPAGP